MLSNIEDYNSIRCNSRPVRHGPFTVGTMHGIREGSSIFDNIDEILRNGAFQVFACCLFCLCVYLMIID